MITPPTGEVTLVFTDIEGSTKLWQQWAGLFESVLATHHNVIRHCIRAEGGTKSRRKATHLWWRLINPSERFRFVCALNWHCMKPPGLWSSRMRPVGLRTSCSDGAPHRIALVCHRSSQSADGLLRLDGQSAARIAHAAMGGRPDVAGDLRRVGLVRLRCGATDLGPRPLRDLNDATHLHKFYPLHWRRENSNRPKRLAYGGRTWSLLQTFVGRTSEPEEVASRLAEGHRLLTVVGAGGTGKTRLVCQYGVERVSAYEGGVWFADLSMANTEAELCQCVADALDSVDCELPIEQIGNAIRGRGATLILLDNFEQVVQFSSRTVGNWIGFAPEASFVVTSRERLRLSGEQLLYLDPVGLNEAVALFETRARAVRPDFVVTDANRKAVQEICNRLDCMSLAIELAAARSAILQPSQLLERLSQRFRLLRGRNREGSHRQSTLRNAIDWSWKLLAPYERAALAQLSVFSSRLSLDATEHVINLDAFPDALGRWTSWSRYVTSPSCVYIEVKGWNRYVWRISPCRFMRRRNWLNHKTNLYKPVSAT